MRGTREKEEMQQRLEAACRQMAAAAAMLFVLGVNDSITAWRE